MNNDDEGMVVVNLLSFNDHFGVVLLAFGGGLQRAVGLGVFGLALVCPILKVCTEEGVVIAVAVDLLTGGLRVTFSMVALNLLLVKRSSSPITKQS